MASTGAVGGKTKNEAAEELRRVVATVGKQGEPGEHVRCVVSVSMLTEGWDANNVTHILGIRAFNSQLLCEQVVGRGLRRIDYRPDPKTGLLTEEYVDVYGIPFSVIPFKGRPKDTDTPEDKPKNHVCSLDERDALRMNFPVVEGYVFALRKNAIRCDIDQIEPLELVPNREPTETVVAMKVGYVEGPVSAAVMPFPTVRQTRQEYYRENHIDTVKFEIARRVIDRLLTSSNDRVGSDKRSRVLRLQSRHQLFPQVHRYVEEFLRRKVDYKGCEPGEVGLEQYARQIVERLSDRIEPDDEAGEPPLLPVLNRTKPIGSTGDVNFKTVRPCHATQLSHINQVVLDTETWEASAAFHIEEAARDGLVACYARNEGMGMSIPYEYLGVSHAYEPDFLVRLKGGATLVLEIKGFEDNQTRAKHEAAQKWTRAVNAWGRLGQWRFHVCRDPRQLRRELAAIVAGH